MTKIFEPPEGFIDSTVYVYRLKNNGSRGKLLRTMDPFPGGAVTPNVWRKRKKGARGMPTKYDWDKILPIALKMREKGVVYKEIAEELGVPYASLYYRLTKIEKEEEKKVSTGSIDWEKLYPKVEKLLGEGKDKAEIAEMLDIPFPQLADKVALEEQKKYQKNKEQGQSMTIAGKQKDMKAADPTPQESVPKKAEKEKSFKCAQCGTSLDGEITTCWPRDGREAPLCLDCFRGASKKIDPPTNWDELWPDVKKDLEAGMSQADVARKYNIKLNRIQKKVHRERLKGRMSGANHESRVFDQLKVKWIQDVIDSEVATSEQLVLIEQIQGLEV